MATQSLASRGPSSARPPANFWRALASLVAFAVLIAACTGSDDQSVVDESGDRGTVAGTDTTNRSVELTDIIFDTFGNGEATLADATEDQIVGLRDAIPPLTDPPYDPLEGGEWLDDDELLLVYLSPEGNAFGYPHRILNFHEIVNDTLDEQKILVSYCPLCGSGVVYDRHVGDDLLTFGNTSALYENDLVMYDLDTFSYWWQVAGEAVVGERTGTKLTVLPSETLTWVEFTQKHPAGRVLSRDTGFGRDYLTDPFTRLDSLDRDYQARVNEGQTPFPVSDEVLELANERLTPAANVLAVEIGGEVHAYPTQQFAGDVLNDLVGGEPVLIVASADGRGGAAFSARVAGADLTFEVAGSNLRDDQTGSTWNRAGLATEGELAGSQLNLLPVRTSFWFALVAAFPDAVIRGGEEQGSATGG